MRGYFGVAVYRPKNSVNIGSLFRTAQILGGSYLATIGARYRRQPSDVMNASGHMPLYQYDDWGSFTSGLPEGVKVVGVELSEGATLVEEFKHPQRAVYVLGAEDDGIPQDVLSHCDEVVRLRGDRSMNVSVAGSIVLYSRGSNVR